MPILDIDMFDESPKVGDNVKVTGKVKSIDEDTGEVDISYDDVKIVKKKRKSRDNDDDEDDDDVDVVMRPEMFPESQSLDTALGAYPFSNTQ